ncbi:MAG: thermonuclease family protein [Candidatus Electrothrix sp. GM3_4]|nr:thermonuclease family protein [Candidatus Electrothrix sp. GM3_4]
MKSFFSRIVLITLCSAVFLVQGTAALAAKKKSSYGTLTGVRFVKNYDGDTITVDLKGQHPLFGDNIPIRVAGIDTPEIRGKCAQEKELAREAKNVVHKIMSKAQKITLKNVQRGKYFRIIADVQADKKDVADILIKKRLAVRYDGGTKGFDWCRGRKGADDRVDFFNKILK